MSETIVIVIFQSIADNESSFPMKSLPSKKVNYSANQKAEKKAVVLVIMQLESKFSMHGV